MQPNDSDPNPRGDGGKTPLDEPLEGFLDDKATAIAADGTRSGSYASQLERTVPKWIEWMRNRDVDSLEDLSGRNVANYAQYLNRRVQAHEADSDRGITRSSAWTYYNHISAYLTYCREWEYLSENPAKAAKVKNAMPDRPNGSSSDQQFWSPEQRQELLRYVDKRAHDAIEKKGMGALAEVRDRALCYLIGYSGVRGAEVLSLRGDDRDGRSGATWTDVNLEAQTISVFGKSQGQEEAPLTDNPVPALERWRDVLRPDGDGWPLFPTFHAPTLWSSLKEQLDERGHDDIDALLKPYDDPMEAIREHHCAPPALTTAGGRTLLKRLSQQAGVDLDDDSKDYLTLHGARRGAGEMYYREEGASAAQRALRHADPSTTSEMYSHIEASELSEVGSRVFDDE